MQSLGVALSKHKYIGQGKWNVYFHGPSTLIENFHINPILPWHCTTWPVCKKDMIFQFSFPDFQFTKVKASFLMVNLEIKHPESNDCWACGTKYGILLCEIIKMGEITKMRHLYVQCLVFFTSRGRMAPPDLCQWGDGEMKAHSKSVVWSLQQTSKGDCSRPGTDLEANQHMLVMLRFKPQDATVPCQIHRAFLASSHDCPQHPLLGMTS